MIFQSLKHKLKLTTVATRLISVDSHLFRRLSTASSSIRARTPPERRRRFGNHNLFTRLSQIGTTGEKVSDVLHEILRHGKQFTKPDLIYCLKDLRKFGRYHHCLEILEWMEKGRFAYSAGDYALHLDIICKVKGIDEAEKYFDGIPPDVKNHHIYGALLSGYCTKMMTDKAMSLFKTMDELNYASNALAFNNLMGLYMKVGKPEKVPSLIEEMKQRNIPLTNHTYYIWIQSYRYLDDLEGVEKVMHEVGEQDSVKEDWQIYSNLAAVYIGVGEIEKANSALIKVEELLNHSKKGDRDAYHHLITMYASTGNLESVYQAWHMLKSRFKVCQSTSYLTMLRSLSKLDDIEGLKKCLKEWESSYKSYDDRLPTVVIEAYLSRDMLEEAEQSLKDVEHKVGKRKIKIAHVIFMNYFVEKHQFTSALKHMEAAIAAKWKPLAEKLEPFFQHFKEEKDVDSAEEFCQKLKKAQLLDSRTYFFLLRTYVAAGKTAPEMRQRMEKSGVDISTEHEELLQKIC